MLNNRCPISLPRSVERAMSLEQTHGLNKQSDRPRRTGRTMSTTSETELRELNRRSHDGIKVRLLWNARTKRHSVALEDERSGKSFEFEIDSADALAAFHHP